jgi:hypothetical protein
MPTSLSSFVCGEPAGRNTLLPAAARCYLLPRTARAIPTITAVTASAMPTIATPSAGRVQSHQRGVPHSPGGAGSVSPRIRDPQKMPPANAGGKTAGQSVIAVEYARRYAPIHARIVFSGP